ncbi:hypothetical protein ACOME3_008816 [Neoechinorhynchus agilis]
MRQLGKMLSSSEEYDGKYIEVTELKPPDALSTPRSYERVHISWIRLMKQKEEDDKHTDWSHDTKKCRDYDWKIFSTAVQIEKSTNHLMAAKNLQCRSNCDSFIRPLRQDGS